MLTVNYKLCLQRNKKPNEVNILIPNTNIKKISLILIKKRLQFYNCSECISVKLFTMKIRLQIVKCTLKTH